MRIIAVLAMLVAFPAVTSSAAAQERYNRSYEVQSQNDTYQHGARASRPSWHSFANYDHDRFEDGQKGYYADRYYRSPRHYKPRPLGLGDRIYRGANGLFYCRRDDGTTGLISGSSNGNVFGDTLARGGSSLIRTLIRAGGQSSLQTSIDRGKLICR